MPLNRIQTVYGQINTQSINTGLTAERYAGSTNARTINMKSTVYGLLGGRHQDVNLIYHYMQRAVNGTITLHTAVPMHQYARRMINGSPANTQVTVFVSIEADPNQYNRNSDKAIVFANSNAGLIDKFFESKSPFTGFFVTGNLTSNLIPHSIVNWNKPHKDNADKTQGQVLNEFVIRTWHALQQTQASESLAADEKQIELEKLWSRYEKALETAEKGQLLTMSNLVYANNNGIMPAIIPFANVVSPNPYLDGSHMYGNKDSRVSFAPEIFGISATGIFTESVQDERSGYQYGTFAIPMRGNDDEQPTKGKLSVVPEDKKSTVPETCTRELRLADGAGNDVFVQARVSDLVYGSENIVKRSRSFSDYGVNTLIQINGAAYARNVEKGCLAIKFEITSDSLEHKPFGSTSTNVVLGDVSTTMLDLDSNEDFELGSSDDVETLSIQQEENQNQETEQSMDLTTPLEDDLPF